MTLIAPTSTKTRSAFRLAAFAEAVSWGGLLIAMFFKWVVQEDPHGGIEGGVPIMGPIHGALFVTYVIVTLVAARRLRWSLPVILVALAAAIPPFCTAIFEWRADKRGLLGRSSS